MLERKGQDWSRQEVPWVRLFLTLFSPKIPPVKVVARGWGPSTEDLPTPLVHQVAKGQEGNFLEGHL